MANHISSLCAGFSAFNCAQSFLGAREAEGNIALGNQVLEGGGDLAGVSQSQVFQLDSLIEAWNALQDLSGKESISFKRHFFFLMIPFILCQINYISKNHETIYQKLSFVKNTRVKWLVDKFLRCDEVSTKKKVFRLVEKQTKKLMDCMGAICVTAFVVMNISLLYLGSRIYPVITLGLMGLASLEKYKIQSGLYSKMKKIQKTYLRCVPLVLYPLVIIQQKKVFLKVMHTVAFGLSLRSFLKDHFFSRNYRDYESKDDATHDLTPNQFLALFPLEAWESFFKKFNLLNPREQYQFSHLEDCVLRREHVLIRPFPTVKDPKEKIPQVMSCWDEFVWEDYIEEIDKVIRDCNREKGLRAWMPEEENISEKKIAYVRALLQELVSDIKEETINVGEPLDYATLQNQLGYIGENISQVDKELQRQVLLYLALEGGGVCGTGIYEQVSVAAHKLLMRSNLAAKLSLKRRFLLQLRQERERIAHALYLHWHEVFKASSPQDNVHAMSLFKLMFALDFGVEDEGARNDVTLRIRSWFEKIEKRIVDKQLLEYRKVNAENLWEDVFRFQKGKWELNKGYTPERIFQTIKDSINNCVITNSDFYDWMKVWMATKAAAAIESQELSLDEKKARKQEFENCLADLIVSSSENEEFGTVEKLKGNSWLLMLIDMGVLSIKKTQPVFFVNAEGSCL